MRGSRWGTAAGPGDNRREPRATLLLTAWLNRYDTGDNQTLSMWIPAGEGRGWVRHHMIDWNDSPDFLWPQPGRVHVRAGRVVGLERPEEQSLPSREAGR